MKAYYLLGQILRPVLTAGFYLFCVITGTTRVRVVAKNQHDEVLLVKTWLSADEWGFPGGGVDGGESHQEAACRELWEETGIKITPDQLDNLGVIRTWRHDEVIFSARIPKVDFQGNLPSRFEVKEAAWFSRSAMPKLGKLANEIVKKW